MIEHRGHVEDAVKILDQLDHDDAGGFGKIVAGAGCAAKSWMC